ncbi:hypothetical protein SDC9_116369 [bioreactor metagenome]|uniref:Uncharacterized protein n=1 Tax=bioreactor metagenome TaxID=1076179 RepID=A0A645C645_9ZZZZ
MVTYSPLSYIIATVVQFVSYSPGAYGLVTFVNDPHDFDKFSFYLRIHHVYNTVIPCINPVKFTDNSDNYKTTY